MLYTLYFYFIEDNSSRNGRETLKRSLLKYPGKLTFSRLESKNINPESAKQEVDLKEAFSGFWVDLLKDHKQEPIVPSTVPFEGQV